jgi:hypothetical protein
MKKKSVIFIIFIISISSLFFLEKIRDSAKTLLPSNLKVVVKELFFGKEFIEEVNYFKVSNLNQKIIPNSEFQKLNFEKFEISSLDVLEQTHYNKIQKKQSNNKTFYIEIVNQDLFLATVKGKFVLFENANLKNKIFIKNNLEEFKASYLMDVAYIKNEIFVSFRHEPENSKCSYFHVVKGNFNKEYIKFESFFNPNLCKINNYGGRIAAGIKDGEEGVYITTGATGNEERHLAQDDKSYLGKIIFINSKSKNLEIISKGHRNPQGLLVDSNIILSTEHGPYGGDEINLIEAGNNYGWPISSYGESYKYFEDNHNKTNYAYKKDHLKNGFIEPIFSFVPSIGISELIKIPNSFSKYWKDNFFISSLNGVSLYRIEFDKNFSKVKYLEKIILLERIRDIKYLESKKIFVLALESTGAIGFLSVKN